MPVGLTFLIFLFLEGIVLEKKKKTLKGQSGKTGRSQMVLVVIASLQCHDNSQQLRACSTPFDHAEYYVTFECLFTGLTYVPQLQL